MTIHRILINTSAIIALGTVAYEAHKMGARKSSQNMKLGGAKDTIRDTIGASKLNYPSPLYGEVKKGIFGMKTPNPAKDAVHGASGYFNGFMSGVGYNIPTIGFAALTLACKTKMKDVPVTKIVKGVSTTVMKQKINLASLKTVGVIGLGLSVVWNFLKHGTNLLEQRNYLD